MFRLSDFSPAIFAAAPDIITPRPSFSPAAFRFSPPPLFTLEFHYCAVFRRQSLFSPPTPRVFSLLLFVFRFDIVIFFVAASPSRL